MSNLTPKASQRVRFEEVTPAHEYAAFFSFSIAPLVAHLGLPIFDGYDDLDDLQLAFLALPSGETVTLSEYAGAPGTSLSVEVAMQHIPQIIFDSCQQLRVSRQEIEWVHPNWQVEFERLYAEYGEVEGIDRISTSEALSKSNEYEPIDCFYHALEIYTRPKFPKHWAMLQHNLGLAYFDRIKGERWENLQKSIQCFYNSLEVFTQDKFPKKWQINQEDLSQSRETLKIKKQNLIRDILNRPRANRSLKYTDLSSAHFHGANLSSANLHDAKLSGADLIDADLSSANLSGTNLRGAKLNSADLSNANLSGANLHGANLSSANLHGANLSGAILSYTTNVYKAQFGDNQGISESMREDLRAQGAIFEDSPGERSKYRNLVPR
jgi:Pentapeptide repeats (8 copies)